MHSIGKVVGGVVGAATVIGAVAGGVWLARGTKDERATERAAAQASVRTEGPVGASDRKVVPGEAEAKGVAPRCTDPACRNRWPVPARYIAVGGGAFPENTEVSLEQDLLLLTEYLGPASGVVLFGGGAEAFSVRELRSTPLSREQELLRELGQFFAPRQGRDSRYRVSELDSVAASLERVESRLAAEFELKGEPLLLYIATHGEAGNEPADAAVSLWGGMRFGPRDLATLHDGSPRPLRLVVTSCYSGGFAELAFNGADSDAGAALADRCGVFAGTWDRETSGCDPDPERRHQESYALHLLHALRGEQRDGKSLAGSPVDVDGDGAINLLEAHTWARASARSIDLPTTTSERLLRAVQSEQAAVEPELVPEESALIKVLGERLGVESLAAGKRELLMHEGRLRALDGGLSEAEERLDEAYFALATRILSRFPVLSDAYHPDFAATLKEHGAAITSLLRSSKEAEVYDAARQTVTEFDAELARAQVREAELQRFTRAWETLGLAAGLKARGGPDFEDYQRLLRCERALLPLRQ